MTVEITDEMIDAVAMRVDDLDPGNQVRTAHIRAILAAAAPHLRAAWEQELARAVKRLPWNGVTHGGTMVPLDSVLTLLEGSGE